MNNKNIIVGGLILVLIFVGVILYNRQPELTGRDTAPVKIGVVTDLTGPGAYWGESTRVGAELAAQELKEEGYDVTLVFEDYKLETRDAVNAAQKLINADRVNAIYADFNPAAVAVGSLMKDKDTLFMYAAAVTSPLEDSPYTYKTYLDYEASCRTMAEKFQEEGARKLGLLKLNWEAGELCQQGVRSVYGDNALIESYNFNDTDFRTQLTKLTSAGAQAILNPALEEDTLTTLRNMRELGMDIPFSTSKDNLSEEAVNDFAKELAGGMSFGFDISPEFTNKVSGHNLSTQDGAAMAYVHVKQLVRSLAACDNDTACAAKELDQADSDDTIGFKQFKDRIADLEMKIERH